MTRCIALALALLPTFAHAATFTVSFDNSIRDKPATGRIVVYLLPGHPKTEPADDVFYAPPRPMFGMDVRDLKPGDSAKIDDTADVFPAKLSALSPGEYTAQAVLDINDATSDWRSEAGNLFSEPTIIKIEKDSATIALSMTQLTHEVTVDALPPGVEIFSIRSKLLSNFAGREVKLNATVLMPTKVEANRKYAAIYHSPSFGDRHWDGIETAERRAKMPPSTNPASRPAATLAENVIEIFLDPESLNGHTFFCDSAVNGPWGKALTEELIPALEAKYPLIAEPMARLVRGHSSGGWSTLWLVTEYPNVFGAGWSSSPDPVDLHRFESSNLYDQKNFYRDDTGKPFPSFREGKKVILHIEDENRMEAVVGPRNTSGQQWAAWMSCWGTRDTNGRAKPLWNPQTGEIDHAEAETYKKYDLVERLKSDPKKYGPIFAERVHLVAGEADSFYLGESVALLKAELAKLNVDKIANARGYIKLVAKADHSTIFRSAEIRAFPQEILAHLQEHGYVK